MPASSNQDTAVADAAELAQDCALHGTDVASSRLQLKASSSSMSVPETAQHILYAALLLQAAPDQGTVVADADELMQGCREQLGEHAPKALNNEDLLGSLLLNGWLQRYCLM